MSRDITTEHDFNEQNGTTKCIRYSYSRLARIDHLTLFNGAALSEKSEDRLDSRSTPLEPQPKVLSAETEYADVMCTTMNIVLRGQTFLKDRTFLLFLGGITEPIPFSCETRTLATIDTVKIGGGSDTATDPSHIPCDGVTFALGQTHFLRPNSECDGFGLSDDNSTGASISDVSAGSTECQHDTNLELGNRIDSSTIDGRLSCVLHALQHIVIGLVIVVVHLLLIVERELTTSIGARMEGGIKFFLTCSIILAHHMGIRIRIFSFTKMQ
ncbi:hypothetical protein BLNAU_2067 [Blattamonas nauphoetae]|uniref:Uncharacterized protein n=1 Tax=Blattamonas nauphoetae TaxID=2049346 RepID=A0ABQ9YH19_9EUKA|nr:hypothetical protein BLNAU_2067 [Blattamonas nauphoetae]